MIERLVVVAIVIVLVSGVGLAYRMRSERRRRRLIGTRVRSIGGSTGAQILAFSGPGCHSCVVQKQILENPPNPWDHSVEIRHVDASRQYELARSFGVITVPTTVITAADGRIVGINTGITNAEILREQISRAA